MKCIITKDGSVTFYSEEYKESYHSVSGAIEESLKKFVEPCKIKELAEGMNVAGDFAEHLNGEVTALIKKACERAKANKRSTIQARDL